jgi:hypothetical protein
MPVVIACRVVRSWPSPTDRPGLAQLDGVAVTSNRVQSQPARRRRQRGRGAVHR